MTEEKFKSVLARLLEMSEEDVRAIERLGLGVEDVNFYIHGKTLEQVGKVELDDEDRWRLLKRWLVEIPGGVIVLKKAREA